MKTSEMHPIARVYFKAKAKLGQESACRIVQRFYRKRYGPKNRKPAEQAKETTE